MSLATKAKADGASVVAGEFPLTEKDFDRIAALLREDSGIHLPKAKMTFVYSRLAKRVRALGLESFAQYCELIDGAAGAPERALMLTALTTNVTRFFREPHHFEHFAADVMPALAAEARAGGRVRLWSAGCSTGQEPYTLALTVLATLPEAADLDVRILATDIDSKVVATAREAIYDQESIDPIPAAMRRQLKKLPDGRWEMSPEARRLVVCRELNLMGDWPMQGKFTAIFCRNVAIYFDDPTQERLFGRFVDGLVPRGYLYVGHSERVSNPKLDTCGLTTYRLKGA
ncbi:MAG: protein-glutamate O-methyltransferase [Phenylobacterium sp.]